MPLDFNLFIHNNHVNVYTVQMFKLREKLINFAYIKYQYNIRYSVNKVKISSKVRKKYFKKLSESDLNMCL